MKYHFFTRSELENLYINVDSAINFQEKIAKCTTYEEFKIIRKIYFEIDTVLYQLDNRDTIACRYDNRLQINDNSDGLAISPDTKTNAVISLTPLISCFISNVGYGIHKPSELTIDSLSQSIGFSYPGYKGDGFDADLHKSAIVNQDNTYFIVSRDKFILSNLQIENCLFVRFYNTTSIEQAVIIYSNKYGFLKIKNNQHEITRIL